jgi:hypothetical protein
VKKAAAPNPVAVKNCRRCAALGYRFIRWVSRGLVVCSRHRRLACERRQGFWLRRKTSTRFERRLNPTAARRFRPDRTSPAGGCYRGGNLSPQAPGGYCRICRFRWVLSHPSGGKANAIRRVGRQADVDSGAECSVFRDSDRRIPFLLAIIVPRTRQAPWAKAVGVLKSRVLSRRFRSTHRPCPLNRKPQPSLPKTPPFRWFPANR